MVGVLRLFQFEGCFYFGLLVRFHCISQFSLHNKMTANQNDELTVAPSYVPCSDPACLTFGRRRFFCLAFLRSWERTWRRSGNVSNIWYLSYFIIVNSSFEQHINLTLMLCPLERRNEMGTPVTRAIST